MAVASKGAIVSFPAIPNFHQLSTKAAQDILYGQLIPACEAQKVKLSCYGNHAGAGTLKNVEEYDHDKAAHKLFNVERIKKAFASLDAIVKSMSKYTIGSYGLKHTVENYQGEYITNGDLIAAMMLKGYEARFGKKTESMDVNCQFKAKVIAQI